MSDLPWDPIDEGRPSVLELAYGVVRTGHRESDAILTQ